MSWKGPTMKVRIKPEAAALFRRLAWWGLLAMVLMCGAVWLRAWLNGGGGVGGGGRWGGGGGGGAYRYVNVKLICPGNSAIQ